MSLQYIQNEIDKTINNYYFYITSSILNKKNVYDDEFLLQNLKKTIDFVESIDMNKLREIVALEDNVALIVNTITKYLIIYFMIYVMLNHENTILNYLIKIKANGTSNLTAKLIHVLDEITNDDVIKIKNINEMVLKIQELLRDNLSDEELLKYAKNEDYKQIMRKINELGNEYVTAYFKSSNKQDNTHNMIKTMILIEIYNKNDKNKIYKIIEEQILNKSEYIYIDVVLSKNSVVTYDVIDLILTEKEKQNNCAYYIYEGINEINNVSSMMKSYDTVDNKIENLFSTKTVVPITDNILLYHKNNEKYVSQSKIMKQMKDIEKNSQTKIEYINNKISNAVNNDNPNWYLPNYFDNYLSINHYENININNKLNNATIDNTQQQKNQLFVDIFAKAYIDFAYNPSRIEFKFVPNKTIDVVKKNKTKLVHCLTASEHSQCNIAGLLFKPFGMQLECIKNNDIVNESIANILYDFGILHDDENKNQKLPYAIYFNNNTELLNTISQYENIDNVSNNEIAKIIIAFVYDKLSEKLYVNLTKHVKKSAKIQLQILNKILKQLNSNILLLSNKSSYYYDFLKTVHRKMLKQKILKHSAIKIIWNFEKLIDTKLTKAIVSQINTFNIKTQQSGIIKINSNNKKINGDRTVDNIQCQHEIEWNEIKQLKKHENRNNSSSGLYERYLEKFLVIDKDNNYCCKSCGGKLGIENYDVSGQFDDETNQYVAFGTTMIVNLAELPEYSNLQLSIDFISSIVERLILIGDLHAFGKKSIVTNLTKNIIDLIIKNNFVLIQNKNKNPNKNLNKNQNKNQNSEKYGILSAIYDNFIIGFDLNDNIYDKSIITLNTQLIKNFIVSYCIAILLLKFNDFNITNFVNGTYKSKKGYCTFETFESMIGIIKNNFIIVNKSGDVDKIENYVLFGYTIYYFSCLCVQYNLWSFPDKNSKMPIKIKIVFDTILSAINTITNNGINKPDDVVLSTYKNLYFITLNKTYGGKTEIGHIKKKLKKNKKELDENENIEEKVGFKMNPNKFRHQSVHLKLKPKKNGKMEIKQLNETNKIKIDMKAINDMLTKANEKHKFVLKTSSNDNEDVHQTYTIIDSKTKTIEEIISANNDLTKSNQNNQIKQFTSIIENIIGLNVTENNIQIGKSIIEILVDVNDNLLKKPIVLTENINKSTTFYEKIIQINDKPTTTYVYEHSNVKQYFDYKNHTLIGATLHGKFERVISKHVNGIKINYDLEYQLKMLGFENMIEENKSTTDIFENRLLKIKNIFMLLQQILSILSDEKVKEEFKEHETNNSNFYFKPNLNNVTLLKELLNKYKEYNLSSIKEKIVNLFDTNLINTIHSTVVNSNVEQNVNLNTNSISSNNLNTDSISSINLNTDTKSNSINSYLNLSKNAKNDISEQKIENVEVIKMDNIVHLDKNGNLLINYFLYKIIELTNKIQKNESKIILKIILDIISFYNQTTNSIYFNYELKTTKYKLDATILFDELSGITDEMTSATIEDDESKTEIESDNNPDDEIEGAEDIYDTDGDFDYEGMYEQGDK